MKHGAQVNIKNCFGATALDYAVKANNLGMAELLVKHGAMINVPNGAGVTPMMVAAHMSGSEVVQVLLANGAQIDFQNKGRCHLKKYIFLAHMSSKDFDLFLNLTHNRTF